MQSQTTNGFEYEYIKEQFNQVQMSLIYDKIQNDALLQWGEQCTYSVYDHSSKPIVGMQSWEFQQIEMKQWNTTKQQQIKIKM